MAKTTLEVTILDDKWPKLRIVCLRRSSQGEPAALEREVLYDQAAVQFESVLMNLNRAMVTDIIAQRKQQQNQSKGE